MLKTLEQAAELPGVTLKGEGLVLHFNPLLNWYWCITGFECPCCEHKVTWEWVNGSLPGLTSPEAIQQSGVRPDVTGGTLEFWGHRFINITCDRCGTYLSANNFDY